MQSILEKDNGIFNTALNFFDLVKGGSSNTEKEKANYMGGSISKYVKDLVMTFPTMFDTSLSPSTAGMISKANERNIVTMLELLFGSMQLTAKNGQEALKQVHNNMAGDISVDDILDIIESNVVTRETGNNIAGIRVSDYVTEMTAWLKVKRKSYPVSSLRETSLNNFRVMRDYYGRTMVFEAKPATKSERKFKVEDRLPGDQFKDALANGTNPYQPETDSYYNWEEEQRQKERSQREKERHTAERRGDNLPSVMTDMDYKKANELAPTLMIVTFNRLDDQGNEVKEKTSFIAGVKSRLIPVESSDIIDRLAAKKNTALNFNNFIRATTGEISFVKDFLFAINQSRLLAKNSAKKGTAARMWNVLDARHVKNNRNKLRRAGNDASAITTLVINQETANMLKKEYNYDIEDAKTAKYIMSEYNLLGLVICDESIEVAKILYHGNDSFEHTPYTFLNRENNDSKAYKEVINLVNKTGR